MNSRKEKAPQGILGVAFAGLTSRLRGSTALLRNSPRVVGLKYSLLRPEKRGEPKGSLGDSEESPPAFDDSEKGQLLRVLVGTPANPSCFRNQLAAAPPKQIKALLGR